MFPSFNTSIKLLIDLIFKASSLFKQARKLYDNALFDKEFLIKLESIEQLANTNKVNDAQIKTDSIDEKPII